MKYQHFCFDIVRLCLRQCHRSTTVRSNAEAIESATATSGSFQLDGNRVQTLDINGDGYADLTNTTSGAFIIADPSRIDWALPNTTLDVTELETVQFSDARFFDYDNDKKIDVLISTASTTQILANTGTSFDRLNVSSFGAGFADSDLLLSDINGDGMNDVVDVLSGGEMRYRINLGKGKFTDWRGITDVSIPLAEQDLMDLEDLNGDGRDDVPVTALVAVAMADQDLVAQRREVGDQSRTSKKVLPKTV